MARIITTPGLEAADDRTFSSPIALAFVRIVMQRRGISETRARQIYLDYLNRADPERPASANDA